MRTSGQWVFSAVNCSHGALDEPAIDGAFNISPKPEINEAKFCFEAEETDISRYTVIKDKISRVSMTSRRQNMVHAVNLRRRLNGIHTGRN